MGLESVAAAAEFDGRVSVGVKATHGHRQSVFLDLGGVRRGGKNVVAHSRDLKSERLEIAASPENGFAGLLHVALAESAQQRPGSQRPHPVSPLSLLDQQIKRVRQLEFLRRQGAQSQRGAGQRSRACRVVVFGRSVLDRRGWRRVEGDGRGRNGGAGSFALSGI